MNRRPAGQSKYTAIRALVHGKPYSIEPVHLGEHSSLHTLQVVIQRRCGSSRGNSQAHSNAFPFYTNLATMTAPTCTEARTLLRELDVLLQVVHQEHAAHTAAAEGVDHLHRIRQRPLPRTSSLDQAVSVHAAQVSGSSSKRPCLLLGVCTPPTPVA